MLRRVLLPAFTLAQYKEKKRDERQNEMGDDRPSEGFFTAARGNEIVILLLLPAVGLSTDEIDHEGYRVYEDAEPEE